MSEVNSNINSAPALITVVPWGSQGTAYANTRECRFCLYTFANDYPHFRCNSCRLNVCQSCFIQWVSGKIKADNVGFTVLSCSCGNKIEYNTIKNIFPIDDFIKYDNALTRFALEKEKNIIYCPGKDCPNIFIKPKLKKTKRQCRKATCDHCETSFCCLCGDLYTLDHSKMKCGEYKKWKHENDDETKALEKFFKSERDRGYIKPCPNCKRNVEKKGGCSDMKCTNCDTRFCWICLNIKTGASCLKCAESLRAREAEYAEAVRAREAEAERQRRERESQLAARRVVEQPRKIQARKNVQNVSIQIPQSTKRQMSEPDQPQRRNAARACKIKKI